MAAWKVELHSFTRKSRSLPWYWCAHCGLLELRNEATERAKKLGCNWSEHPSMRRGAAVSG